MKKGIVPLLFAFLVGLLGAGTTFSKSSLEFYYFNPDSSYGNLGRLKGEMDNFFSKAKLSISFQPFSHLSDLERKIRKDRPALALLPQWYWKKHGDELHLRPFLKPPEDKEGTYRKILLVSKQSDINLHNLENHSLAMTTLGPEGHEVLQDILPKELEINTRRLNIVVVPKDTDALFALALGHVEMALVSKENLKIITRLNPNLVKNINALIETRDIPLPVLCYSEKISEGKDIERFKNVFLDPGGKGLRRKIMEILHVHAW